jgi:hypothetical protein
MTVARARASLGASSESEHDERRFGSERRPSSPGEGRHRFWPREKNVRPIARLARANERSVLEEGGSVVITGDRER